MEVRYSHLLFRPWTYVFFLRQGSPQQGAEINLHWWIFILFLLLWIVQLGQMYSAGLKSAWKMQICAQILSCISVITGSLVMDKPPTVASYHPDLKCLACKHTKFFAIQWCQIVQLLKKNVMPKEIKWVPKCRSFKMEKCQSCKRYHQVNVIDRYTVWIKGLSVYSSQNTPMFFVVHFVQPIFYPRHPSCNFLHFTMKFMSLGNKIYMMQ